MDLTTKAEEENRRLRKAMRDLVAFSTLSSTWNGMGLEAIALSLADGLVDTLPLEFVCIRLTGLKAEDHVEVLRGPLTIAVDQRQAAQAAIEKLTRDPEFPNAPNPVAFTDNLQDPAKALLLNSFEIGDALGFIVTGSADTGYPSEEDRTLLRFAIEQTSVVVQRRQTERALWERERELSLVTENAPVFLVHCDCEARYQYVNQRYAERLGMKPADIIGKRIEDVIGIKAYASFQPLLQRAMNGEVVEFEVEIPYERIGTHVMQCACAPDVSRDGQVCGVVAVLIDVTDRRRAEDALRASEQRFSRFMQHLPGLAWIKDTQGRYVYANEAALAAFGTTREKLLGRKDAELFSADTALQFQQNDERAIATRAGIQAIEELVHEDGDLRYSLVNKFPLIDSDGTVTSVGGMAMDVTEQRRIEQALRQSESRFRGLMEQAPYSIQVLAPNGRTLRVNRAWEKLWGLTLAQIADYNILEDPQLAAKGLLPFIRRGFAGEVTLVPPIQYDPTAVVPSSAQPQDASRWVAATIYPLKNELGQIDEIVLVHEDITARKRAEDALHRAHRELEDRIRCRTAELVQANEFLNALLENVQTGVVACDADGFLTIFNGVTRSLHGLPVEPIRSEGWAKRYRLFQSDGQTPMAESEVPLFRALQGERVHEAEMVIRPLNQSPRTVQVSGQAFFDSLGVKLGAVVSMQDITARKVAEESLLKAREELALRVEERTAELGRANEALREADRRKDVFLATLAHELRNPLAPIRNSLQILGMNHVDATTVQEVRAMMERQVYQLVRLVDDLLDVSRVMRDKIELRRELVDVATIIDRAVETAQPLLDLQGHQLKIDLPAHSLMLDGDPVRLAQVFGNLLTNAAKYTDANGRIWLSAAQENAVAVLRVRDNGIGIAPEMLARIFDLFVQVDHASTKAQGGLGIGLTLVKNLIELHGGSIEVHSRGLGFGSEFVIRLPLSKATQTLLPERGDAEHSGMEMASGHRLLVVDDNQDAANSLAMLLKLQGHEVQVAHSGWDALELVQHYAPDVVFLDIGMPGMDGFEVARRLREQPRLAKVVLAALTGWGQPEDRMRTKAAGFNYHLVKPPEITAIESLIALLERPNQKNKRPLQ